MIGYVAVAVIIGVACAVIAMRVSGGGDGGATDGNVATLSGASLVAAGNEDYFSQREFDGSIDELPPLRYASMLVADGENVWVVFQDYARDPQMFLVNPEDPPTWEDTRPIYPEAVFTTSGGQTAIVETGVDGREHVGFSGWDLVMDARFRAWTAALDAQGNVLVGSAADTRIDLFEPATEEVRRLVGPPGDAEAEVQLAEPIDRVLRIVPFDDGRIAFLALASDTLPDPATPTTGTSLAGDPALGALRPVEFTAEELRLYVLDGTEVRQVDADLTELLSPAAAGLDDDDARVRHDALPLEPIAPGPEPAVSALPDNKLITIGDTAEGPAINVLDVDTGGVTHLVTLEGVEPSHDEPVFATVVHGDLYFLADGRLWHLPDAYP